MPSLGPIYVKIADKDTLPKFYSKSPWKMVLAQAILSYWGQELFSGAIYIKLRRTYMIY